VDLQLSGNTLSLTNDATTVDLSGYLDNADAQSLQMTGDVLSISGGAGSVDLSLYGDDADANATNEIQDLSLTGNILNLTNDATTVDLSGYLDDTNYWTTVGDSVIYVDRNVVPIPTFPVTLKLPLMVT